MTKTSLFVIFTLVFAAVPVRAEDWTVNGKTYHNVIVTEVYSDQVTVDCASGMTAFFLKDLSPELQKHFAYDPDMAQQAFESRGGQLVAQTDPGRVPELTDDEKEMDRKKVALGNGFFATTKYDKFTDQCYLHGASYKNNVGRSIHFMTISSGQIPAAAKDCHIIVSSTAMNLGDSTLIHVYADGVRWDFQTTLRQANPDYQLYEIVVPLDCLKALAKADDAELKPDDSSPIAFTCSLKAYALAYLAYITSPPANAVPSP